MRSGKVYFIDSHDRIQGFDDKKIKLKLQEKPSTIKREHPALQK
jgi:hypothetical protein